MPNTNTSKPSPTPAKSKAAKRSPVIPATKPLKRKSGFLALPFVYRAKCGPGASSNWQVPPAKNYEQACRLGREYAVHFVLYLTDHAYAFGANALGHIVKDINFKDSSDAKGYWVGFFSYLERLLHAQAQNMDVWVDVEQFNASFVKRKTRRARP